MNFIKKYIIEVKRKDNSFSIAFKVLFWVFWAVLAAINTINTFNEFPLASFVSAGTFIIFVINIVVSKEDSRDLFIQYKKSDKID